MSQELKPCAHCADTRIPKWLDNGRGLVRLECLGCGCGTGWHESNIAAIASWNRREPESASQPGDGEARNTGLEEAARWHEKRAMTATTKRKHAVYAAEIRRLKDSPVIDMHAMERHFFNIVAGYATNAKNMDARLQAALTWMHEAGLVKTYRIAATGAGNGEVRSNG